MSGVGEGSTLVDAASAAGGRGPREEMGGMGETGVAQRACAQDDEWNQLRAFYLRVDVSLPWVGLVGL